MRSKFGKTNKRLKINKMQWMTIDTIMVHPFFSLFLVQGFFLKSWDLFAHTSKKKNKEKRKIKS
jgi:hypothetical protein